jgi:hypothetical protein
MDQQKVSVDGWVARQQDGQRLSSKRDRREAIRRWVTVAVVLCAIVAVMIAFGQG